MNDYILPPLERDWAALLEKWNWLLPESFGVWFANRFGDLFLILEDGGVAMLDINAGTLTRIAESQDDFSQKLAEGDNARVWLYTPLVDALNAAGTKSDDADRVYAFGKPILLGGEIAAWNVQAGGLGETLGFTGDLAGQLRGVADGAEVGLKVRAEDGVACGKAGCCGGDDQAEGGGCGHDHRHGEGERCSDGSGRPVEGCDGRGGCGGRGGCAPEGKR